MVISLAYEAADIALCSVIVMYVIVQTMSFHMSQNGKWIVLTGFFVRLVLACWGTYGDGALAVWLSSGDQEDFLRIALQYFTGDFSEQWTRYPYVVYMIFRLTGPNRIMPKLINIFCWFLGILILQMVAGGLYGRKKIMILFAYTFLPYALLVSTQLMRESMISLFSMLCVLSIYNWMDSGNVKHMLIVLVCASAPVALHAGNIALVAGAFLVYMLWDYKAGKWRKFDWCWIVIILCIIMAVPFYNNFFARFLGYFPRNISFETITGKPFNPGRSDYGPSAVVKTLGQFIFWGIYRILYFWISPTPRFWNSPIDVIGFLFDSIPMILVFLQIFRNIKRNMRQSKSLAGLYVLGVYTVIYGFGTSNAGTAIRHRDQLWGMMIMAVLAGMNRGVRYE